MWINGKKLDVQQIHPMKSLSTKSEFRKAIASEKLKDNNDMMEAKFKDMKGFSRMVNKKRNTPRGDTGLLIIDEQQFSGDAQVLSGFFEYHKTAQTAPQLTNGESDHLYKSATIDISSIQYIIRSRGWKLPSLSTTQVPDIISRLKSGKSPDYFGLTSDHVKNGGSVAILYITKYLNMTFKWMEFGVSEEELIGTASMIYKGKGKSLINPKSFRKITVCAMLGKIKEMAICDYSAPILRPFKAQSQIGFSAGLFVKLSNILVTEKRAIAYKFDHVILHMFLDADAAFDKALHEIIMRTMYHSGLQDDSWKYFLSMHKMSQTHIKWKSRISDDKFVEDQGTRQGGVAGPQEYKFYVNPMVSDLEKNCGDDRIAGHPSSVVAVADDVAPTSRGILPREALHNLQNLLNIVEDWGHQLHIKFGIEKCPFLISARKKKYRQVLDILKEEPEVLTFFGKPVSIVDSLYTHIGVPQAPIKQSAIVVDERIKKGQEISYMMQDVTKNALLGISPLANRNIFQCYHAPSYLYGLDTIHVNQTDITRLEIKFRGEI